MGPRSVLDSLLFNKLLLIAQHNHFEGFSFFPSE